MLKKYVCVDIETTGFNPETDEIIRLSAVKFDDGVDEPFTFDDFKAARKQFEFDTWIKPKKEIPEKVIELLDIEGFEDDIFDEAPYIETALKEFYAFLGDLPVVAHNAEFDAEFLKIAYRRILGREFENRTLCTLVLAKELAEIASCFKQKSYHFKSLVKEFLDFGFEDIFDGEFLNGINTCYSVSGLYSHLNSLIEIRTKVLKKGNPPLFIPEEENVHFIRLQKLALTRLEEKYMAGEPQYVADCHIQRELRTIGAMGLSNFFLTVYDIIKYAKENHGALVFCGGAANGSMVCYALGIININPKIYHLRFSRFINAKICRFPVVTLEVDADSYKPVADYAMQKCGIAENIKINSSKILSLARKTLETQNTVSKSFLDFSELYSEIRLKLAETGAMPENYYLMDKYNFEDILAFLGNPESDLTGVYNMDQNGDIIKTVLQKLSPLTVTGLIATVALARNVPAFNVYIKAKEFFLGDYQPARELRLDEESDIKIVNKGRKHIKSILDETYGVFLYQEQFIEILSVFGEFSYDYADEIRLLIEKKANPQKVHNAKKKFVINAVKYGITPPDAENVFEELKDACAHLFCKAHDVAVAELMFQTAFLKYYYPVKGRTCKISRRNAIMIASREFGVPYDDAVRLTNAIKDEWEKDELYMRIMEVAEQIRNGRFENVAEAINLAADTVKAYDEFVLKEAENAEEELHTLCVGCNNDCYACRKFEE